MDLREAAEVETWGPPRPAHVQLAEKMAAHNVRFVRLAAPDAELTVRLPHARRPGDEEVARVLQCELSYGGSCGAVRGPGAQGSVVLGVVTVGGAC